MKRAAHKASSLTVTGLVIASLITTPIAAQQRVEVGSTASVAGKVTLENDQTSSPIDVKRGQRIAWGDVIRTKKNSQTQILLLDRSNFGIGQKSRVRIDNYVYDPNKGRSLFSTFIKGALRFFSGAEEGDNTAEISTPAGRIGIRGTAIDMLVGKKAEDIGEDEDFVGKVKSDKDEATFVVLRGPGVNTAAGLKPGLAEVTGAGVTIVLDEPGLAAYIPKQGAAPIGPFRISDSGLARVQDQISPRWADSFKDGGIPDEVIVGAAAASIIGILLGTRGRKNVSPPAGTATTPDSCQDANGTPIPCNPNN